MTVINEVPTIFITIANSVNASGVVGFEKYLRTSLINGIATTEKQIGLGTISYSFANGSLTITSDTSGDFPSDVFISPSQLDCDYEYISNQEIIITPNPDYGTLIIKITKES